MRRSVRAARALGWTLFAVAFGTNVPTPLLLVYRDALSLSPTALTGAFAAYAAGLVPALLLAGPASDRLGRRRLVLPASLLAALTSLLFLLAGTSVTVLFAGRFLQGAASGVVFSVGTAWLTELLDVPGLAARLTTVALSAGWALGPLTAGILGQWAPAPTVLPYLVHIGIMAAALVRLPSVPETLPVQRRRRGGPVLNLGVPPAARWPFALVVLPVAIGVFTFPATAVTVLPLLLIPALPGIAVVVTGLVAAVTMLTGAFTQPVQRRLTAARSGPAGLATGATGLGVSLVADALGAWPILLPAALLLGTGYGLCLAAGLTIVARLASDTERGAFTGTFYACAYLGFGTPVLLSALGGATGLGGSLAVLAVAAATVAALLALPPMQRLITAVPATKSVTES